jgi:UDP-N-acetylglucosamine 4,6-dehydratase
MKFMKFLKQLYIKIFTLGRIKKTALLILADIMLIIFSFSMIFFLNSDIYHLSSSEILIIFLSPIIAILLFLYFDLYRIVVRYFSINALWIWTLLKISILLIFALASLSTLLFETVGSDYFNVVASTILSLLFVIIFRVLIKKIFFSLSNKKRSFKIKKILIYGAGEAGVQLKSIINAVPDITVEGFIDDNPRLSNCIVDGLKVHNLEALSDLIKFLRIDEVLLAIPSADTKLHAEILSKLGHYKIRVRTLPNVSEIAHGRVQFDHLQNIDIKELLDRKPISPDKNLLNSNIRGKVVMITGAGGSIGSELCRQVVNLSPKKIILFEQSELALYLINEELSGLFFNVKNKRKIYPILGSITNQNLVERVFERFSVDTIYHAAAYKHVPMVELNTIEGIKNNVFGTLCCVKAAINKGVNSFVLISTDKAVRPTNVMGASKRISEMILQAFANEQNNTKFSAVRFGNVLGSSGSVIPLFEKQIAERKAVTVTHPDVKRYFMTIPEASQLVIQAGSMCNGIGSIFILDMGPLVNIYNLAERMIHLRGLKVKNDINPKGDIQIKITGLREGEKLFEELVIGGEVLKTSHKMISKVNESFLPKAELIKFLEDLNILIESCDYEAIRTILIKNVSGYSPQHGIEDFLYVK